jgi:choline kinase
MHAIILAAGRGNRLAEFNPDGRPKSLLEFEGKSLLQRELEWLYRFGVHKTTLVVGYEADQIIEHVGGLSVRPDVAFVYNPAFTQGSVISLLSAQSALTAGEAVLVMDADVLFHPEILSRLIKSPHDNCFLLDRGFEDGEESVKIAIQNGKMVDFRKKLPEHLQYDTVGESVGFFKFEAGMAARISEICARYKTEGYSDLPHEEVLRDVLLAEPQGMSFEDVSGLPWLEVDFPEDVERAIKTVLPAILVDHTEF